jgi:H+/gluconate symporter-like permease
MRNLRQRFGGFIVAGMLAAILGSATPAFADTGAIGGNGKNTCAFVAGLLEKVPADSGAALMLLAVYAGFNCD